MTSLYQLISPEIFLTESTEKRTVRVTGSTEEPYFVSFERLDRHLGMTCTCQAGRFGQFCKHRAALLQGDTSAVVGDDKALASTISMMLQGSDIEDIFLQVTAETAALDAAKRRLDALKKRMAAVMNQMS